MTQSATGKIKASRVNNLDAATYVGPGGQIWYDINTGVLRLGDNVTPGGTIIGGGSGNANPGGPNRAVQFNNSGSFGGTSGLTFDSTANALTVAGNISTSGYLLGNGALLTGLPTSLVYFTSNVSALIPGYALNISATYGNSQYPGGVFTLYQSPQPHPTLTVINSWASTGTASKNAYTDYANGIINISNVSMTLGISSPATFAIQSTDNIIIGNTVITGTNLTGLGIAGTGGTYNIPSSLIGNSVETASSSSVQVNLTTSAGGPYQATGTTLTTVAPIPFSLSSIAASFTNTTITPGLGNSQPVNYNVSVTTGTPLAGNIIISGAANLTTNVGTTLIGSTANINSTAGNFLVTATYSGNGLFGAGTSTSSANVSLAKVVETTPLFIKSTVNGSNPNFVPTDTNFSTNWVPGPGLPGNQQGVTTNQFNPTTEYYWLAIPDADFWSYPVGVNPINGGPDLYYNYVLTGIGVVNSSFNAAYGNGTASFGGSGGTITIGDVPYVALGFTGFANVQSPSNPANLFMWVSTSATS